MGNNWWKLDCKDSESMFDMDGKKNKKQSYGTKKCVAFKGIPDAYFDTSPFGEAPVNQEISDTEEVGERHNKESKRIVKKGKKLRVYNIKKFDIDYDHLHPEVQKALKICGPYDYSSKFLRKALLKLFKDISWIYCRLVITHN